MRRIPPCTVRLSATDKISVRYAAALTTLLACSPVCFAQSTIEYWSDTPPDARSLSLGEAFVAVAQGPSALFYNVAGMAGQKGPAASFDSRTEPGEGDIFNTHIQHQALAGTFGMQRLGSIGIRYSSYFEKWNSSPTTTDFFTWHVSDILCAYANHISPTLDVGGGIGVAQLIVDYDPQGNSVNPEARHSQDAAVYVDLGFRYHESILKSNVPDELSFAASLSHFGTSLGTAADLARSFRGGLAWKIAQPETTAFANQFFSGMITGQFKKVFNEGDFSTDQIKSNKGYWSMGMEIGIWDMLFLRYGLYYRPYDSQYSYANNAQSNLGGGVRIPIHKIIHMESPLWLSIDYAMMHLLNGSYEHGLSASMHLDHDFFPATPEPVDQ